MVNADEMRRMGVCPSDNAEGGCTWAKGESCYVPEEQNLFSILHVFLGAPTDAGMMMCQ